MRLLQRNLFWPMRQRLAVLLAFVATAVLTVVITLTFFDQASSEHDDRDAPTVRVSAFPHESGNVSVALQLQQANGEWGERLLPRYRVVPVDSEPERWLPSSAVETNLSEPEERPLFCIVAHGDRNDYFWRLLRGYSRQAALDNNLDVRFTQSTSGAEQVAEIERCSADGAAVIAATLVDPETVTPALVAAKEAGARIITFNSGYEHAILSGSELHITLDDAAAGRMAAEEFNQHGATGAMGCVIHERNNVSLETRCDAFDDAYLGGEVVRIHLDEGANADQAEATILARLSDPDAPAFEGLLTLSGSASLQGALQAVIAAREDLDRDVKVGSIGVNLSIPGLLTDDFRRHVLFHIDAAAEVQGYLVTAALHMSYSYTTTARFILRPLILNATPFVYSLEAIQGDPGRLAEIQAGLDARLALGDQYFE